MGRAAHRCEESRHRGATIWAAAACGLLAAGMLFSSSGVAQPVAGSIAVQRARQNPLSHVGLPLGAQIPVFQAKDQDGRLRDFASVSGPNGAVIYFYRSASWCIYCRAQLVETEAAREGLRRNGLGVVGVSYDSPDVLKSFATEHAIGFPLLSDPDSEIIRAFDVLDVTAAPDSPAYGVPYHGTYVVDSRGVVVAKLFDVESTLSHSTGLVVSRLFGSPVNTHAKTVTHERLSLTYYASSNDVSPGDEIELIVDVRLNEGVHVYPPQDGPYIPVELQLEASAAFEAQPTVLPKAKRAIVASTGQTAAIYAGEFRIARRITLSTDADTSAEAIDFQGNFVVKAAFRFQACDDRICYLPTTIPLQWKLDATPPTEAQAGQHHH